MVIMIYHAEIDGHYARLTCNKDSTNPPHTIISRLLYHAEKRQEKNEAFVTEIRFDNCHSTVEVLLPTRADANELISLLEEI